MFELADDGSPLVANRSFDHLPFTLERIPDVFVFLELVLSVDCFNLLEFSVPLGVPSLGVPSIPLGVLSLKWNGDVLLV